MLLTILKVKVLRKICLIASETAEAISILSASLCVGGITSLK
jgi:hypothetical protein